MSTPSTTPLTAGTRRLIPLNHAMPWIVAAICLIILPYVFDSRSALTIMNQMAITIVFALSYNMLLGQGGMLSFGHAVYMGLGGFFCMHLLNMVEYDGLWLPLPLLPLFGGLFGLLFALIIGTFSTRRAGTVFAMISLGVGELIAACSIIIVVFFGGEEGVSGDRTMGPEVFGWDFGAQSQVYYLTAGWLLIAALGMYLYSRTPIGRIANAVRDNEERAEFLGYSQRHVRWISFCASGFFAGIAGALFAINFEILTEENLNLATSGSILLITFLGGVGFFVGPIIGAIVFTLLQTVLSLYTEIWSLYLGILFVATVMFFPGGLAGLLAMHVLPWKLGKLGHLIAPYAKMFLPAIAFVLSSAAVLEILFHRRHASVGDHEMTLYGITFDSHHLLPLIAALALAAVSFWALVKMAPALKEAWDEATHMDAPGAGGAS
ncbi:branched-chain amino acid ABC transporter permease [Alisedimentitalea sp. MJ-SS2]|uniref:branched-chain amino acid ABC transporter permease n=1 Tax=Aliisedimentitalea sp. MJ-SS2 TaxID=3049795 RepID=UPI00290B02B0|nr:branched-chain amino acid ABC transporter permease [Alisedimentitalea sp. MJ-SS2]MDU8928701.1 branched-chain amino acid ABC transporter permease [Alisedimentitalea sp. MJ-SS2]